MATREIRLVPRAVFWRTAALVFVVRQFVVLAAVARFVPRRFRVRAFLFARWGTPRSVAVAVLLACLVTLVAELVVRFLLRPAVRSWLSPPSDDSACHFRLTASERILAVSPARRRQGWLWPAGALVRTNHRVWFFPAAWDAEPSSFLPAGPSDAWLDPAPRRALGLVEGFPDRLVVRGERGDPVVFAVPEPEVAVSWFRAEDATPAPAAAPNPH